jgi:serine/threonine protein kinase
MCGKLAAAERSVPVVVPPIHGWLRQFSRLSGTIDYLPPEMTCRPPKPHDHTVRNGFRGDRLGVAAVHRHASDRDTLAQVDIWCLGVLMYEFLCGAPPFEAPTTDEVPTRGFGFRDHVVTVALVSAPCVQTLLRIAGKKDGEIKFPAHVSLEAKDLIRKVSRVPLCAVVVAPRYLHRCALVPTVTEARSETASAPDCAVGASVDHGAHQAHDCCSPIIRWCCTLSTLSNGWQGASHSWGFHNCDICLWPREVCCRAVRCESAATCGDAKGG